MWGILAAVGAACYFLAKKHVSVPLPAAMPTQRSAPSLPVSLPVASSPALVAAVAPRPVIASAPVATAAAPAVNTAKAVTALPQRSMTLQQYLDAIAASSDPYAKIPTSQYDSAGGYSERAYLLRLSDLCHFDGSPLTGGPDPYEFGWWTGDPVAITGKTNVVKDKERAANAAAQARRSNTKTASTPAWHTQVIRVKAAGKSWLSTITANDSNDNAAYADGIWSEAPPDGSNHPKYFYAWVRLSQNAYCRQFRWCLYGDLLVPVGARDIYNPLTNPIADWLSGIEQIGGFIGAVFTGGAALAVYLVNTIIDETGALVPIPGASDILKLAEKAAQAEG